MHFKYLTFVRLPGASDLYQALLERPIILKFHQYHSMEVLQPLSKYLVLQDAFHSFLSSRKLSCKFFTLYFM